MELGVIMDNDENSGVCGFLFFFLYSELPRNIKRELVRTERELIRRLCGI